MKKILKIHSNFQLHLLMRIHIKLISLIISFQIPQILLENREGNIVMEASTPESGAGFRIQTEESAETLGTYTPDRSRVGTVISTNTTASPSTVTYASGSVLTSDLIAPK